MTVDIYDMAQTWNDGAATFTGIKMNVTDTASAATSKLLDLQVGGVSRCSVIKTGTLAAVAFTAIGSNKSSFTIGTNSADLTQFGGFNPLRLIAGSVNRFSGLQTTNALTMLALTPASNTTEIINGVNAQAFNIYNTYTDASNYERAALRWSGNDFIITSTDRAGTGTNRQMHFYSNSYRWHANGTFWWGMDANGNLAQQNGTSMIFKEMTAPSAPSANSVRIYAEDDGAGKTRLMALFATGVAQQIAIEP